MARKSFVVRFALIATLVSLALALVPGAMAGKPGGSSGGSSLSLVLLNSTDGLAHYGQQVTFNVSTAATTQPYVRLDCYEGGVWTLSSSAGFFDGYLWPWTRNFTLSWDMWHTPGAAADCTATLYSQTKKGSLAKLTFHVYA